MPQHLRLEGPDLEALLDEARHVHGDQVTIVRAERVRTGGVAGFFAKERFQLTLAVPDEPAPRPSVTERPARRSADGEPGPGPKPGRPATAATGRAGRSARGSAGGRPQTIITVSDRAQEIDAAERPAFEELLASADDRERRSRSTRRSERRSERSAQSEPSAASGSTQPGTEPEPLAPGSLVEPAPAAERESARPRRGGSVVDVSDPVVDVTARQPAGRASAAPWRPAPAPGRDSASGAVGEPSASSVDLSALVPGYTGPALTGALGEAVAEALSSVLESGEPTATDQGTTRPSGNGPPSGSHPPSGEDRSPNEAAVDGPPDELASRASALGLSAELAAEVARDVLAGSGDPSTLPIVAGRQLAERSQQLTAAPGEVVLVVGGPGELAATARAVASLVGTATIHVLRPDTVATGALAGATRLASPREVPAAARRARDAGLPVVVATSEDVATARPGDERAAVGRVDPDLVVAAVDADASPRRREDFLQRLGTGSVTVLLALTGCARATAPAAAASCGLPVALLDGRPPTAGAWAGVLLDALSWWSGR